MKINTTWTIVFGLLFVATFVCGQTPCDSTTDSNPYRCSWTYFKIDKSITGTVILHDKALVGCGTRAFASLTIVKIDADTIRVLDLCNQNTYIIGQKIKISPEDEPSFHVSLPATFFIDGIRGSASKKMKRKIRKGQVKISETSTSYTDNYDKSVLKTTWASISVTL